MQLEFAHAATERFPAWWRDGRDIWVSCVQCGYITRSMNPAYTEHVTLSGGEFTCPDCRKKQRIELVGA